MDATTAPRGDDEPTPAQHADAPPPAEPAQRPDSGGSTAAGAEPAPGSPAPSVPPASDDGPEDPTLPDTAVEATLTAEPAGSRAEEPVVPTTHPDDVRVSAPPAEPTEAPAAETQEATPGPPPVAAPAQPVAAPAPAHDVVYVAAPTPPKRKGNRGVGVLLAALSAVLFFAVYAGVVVLINSIQGRGTGVGFLQRLEFYIPVLLFAIGFVLLAAIVNRAGWWSFVLGSFFVGAFVYLGTVGVLLLSQASSLTPDAAVLAFRSLLISPIVVAAGLVAREVSLWVGAAISARGRRIKAKNAEARAEFDRQQAEHRAEIERTGAVVRPA